jgi:hypothetical protein
MIYLLDTNWLTTKNEGHIHRYAPRFISLDGDDYGTATMKRRAEVALRLPAASFAVTRQ